MLYILNDLIYYLVLLFISLLSSFLTKLNIILREFLPQTPKNGPLTSETKYPRTINKIKSELGGKNQPLTINLGKAETNFKLQNNFLLSSFFLQRVLLTLSQLDVNLPQSAFIDFEYKKIINLPNVDSFKKSIHLILYGNSSDKFSLRISQTNYSLSKLENINLGSYSNTKFTNLETIPLSYITFFNLNFTNYKIITKNVSNNLILSKQVKWL
jgi:hypothetical protein